MDLFKLDNFTLSSLLLLSEQYNSPTTVKIYTMRSVAKQPAVGKKKLVCSNCESVYTKATVPVYCNTRKDKITSTDNAFIFKT